MSISVFLTVIAEEDLVESVSLHAQVTSSQTFASLVLNSHTVSAELYFGLVDIHCTYCLLVGANQGWSCYFSKAVKYKVH